MSTQEQIKQHTELAVAALGRGALEEAASEFGRAIYLSPRDVVLRQRLGDLLARMGKTKASVRQFQHVAGHYAAEGQLLKAIAICRVILEMDPAHQETQTTLAELFALQHESVPMVPKLPASMAGAVAGPRKDPATDPATDPSLGDLQRSAPLDPAVTERFFIGAGGPAADEAPTELEAGGPVMLDIASVGRAPLFSSLGPDAFLAVLQQLELRWVKAGEVIVEEGDAADAMYVVVQGTMNVLRGPANAGSKPIAVLGEGTFFGEMALVARSPRLATVVAGKDGLLFAISHVALTGLARTHPSIKQVVDEFFRERLLANLLAVSPLFRAFGPDQKRELSAKFKLHSFASGEPILEQGKPGRGLFVLLRGGCEVFHTTGSGEQLTYPNLKEGDLFGEISLLFDSPCTATVRAETRSEVLELPRPDFNALVLPHPSVKAIVDRIARERLSRTADLLLATDEVQHSWLV